MRAPTYINIACKKCGRYNRKHLAKGLCFNCYHSIYYHTKVKKKKQKKLSPEES